MLAILEILKNHTGRKITKEYLVKQGITDTHRTAASIISKVHQYQERYGVDVTYADDTETSIRIKHTKAYRESVVGLFNSLHDPREYSFKELAERWGCDKATAASWITGRYNRDALIRALVHGLKHKQCSDPIPDLQVPCHERGFSFRELVDGVDMSYNGVKAWRETNISRLWDLIKGYECVMAARVS